MIRKLFSGLAIAAMVSVSGAALAASSVTGMSATLAAAPRAYSGKCPAVITFRGTITVKGVFDPQQPVQIGYQFLRSDGAIGPIAYYMVTASGTRSVTNTWTLGGPSLPSYSGWQQLKAWPTRHEGGFGYAFSEKAPFKVSCTRASAPR
jgi:hypothetical protein